MWDVGRRPCEILLADTIAVVLLISSRIRRFPHDAEATAMDTREVAISRMREGGSEGDTMASAASLQPEGGREGGLQYIGVSSLTPKLSDISNLMSMLRQNGIHAL